MSAARKTIVVALLAVSAICLLMSAFSYGKATAYGHCAEMIRATHNTTQGKANG